MVPSCGNATAGGSDQLKSWWLRSAAFKTSSGDNLLLISIVWNSLALLSNRLFLALGSTCHRLIGACRTIVLMSDWLVGSLFVGDWISFFFTFLTLHRVSSCLTLFNVVCLYVAPPAHSVFFLFILRTFRRTLQTRTIRTCTTHHSPYSTENVLSDKTVFRPL